MASIRERALEQAAKFIGFDEFPPGSNRGPLIDQWNRQAGVPVGSPWCMSFVHAMYLHEGRLLPGGASVGNFEQWAVSTGLLIWRPFRADLVCYEWEADDWPDHIGFVERVLALRWAGGRFTGWIRTIEGNADDAVRRKWRWVNAPTRFVRIPG